MEVGSDILRHLLQDMNALVVLALGVDDVNLLAVGDEPALVADLSAHLTIERSLVEDDLEKEFFFCVTLR